MKVMIEVCYDVDVHQKSITCCKLDGPLDTNKPKKNVRTFGTRTCDLNNAASS